MPFFKLSRLCLLILCFHVGYFVQSTQAQILPDGTLDEESSTLTSDQVVRGNVADVIEGGATRGSNLFHSFSEFNVAEGQRVYFANPMDINAILSRVTGSNPSEILGTLGVAGTADLFFVNPNGLVFGKDALLDVEGSFYGSTADGIAVGDGVFSAVSPGQSQILAVRPDVSFLNFLTNNSGDVVNRGHLMSGGDLGLAGNNLDLQGQVSAAGNVSLLATDTVKIRDTTDTPFVAFSGNELLVQGNQQVDIIALSHEDSGLFSDGDMVLRSAGQIGGDTHYFSGGDFRVEQLDGSSGTLFSPIDPVIRVLGDVDIGSYFGSSLHILSGGSVTLGAAFITGPEVGALDVDFLRETITLTDGTTVQIDGGAQPTLDIRAGVSPDELGIISPLVLGTATVTNSPSSADITVSNIGMFAPSGLVLLSSQYAPNSMLPGGNVSVTGEALGIASGEGSSIYIDSRNDVSVINSRIFTAGAGDVGDIVIAAEGKVILDGTNTGAFSHLTRGETGSSGDIRITAENLEVLNGASLDSSSFGVGNAGTVILDIDETARFEGSTPNGDSPSGASSNINPGGVGTAGDVQINARNLEVVDGAFLSAITSGTGNAGNVILEIDETARFDNGVASSSLVSIDETLVQGAAGDVMINARNLEFLNGSSLGADTLEVGNAGNVIVDIEETARFEDSTVSSSVAVGGEGTGGDVQLRAMDAYLRDSLLFSSGLGQGDAGNVKLTIQDRLELTNSTIDTESRLNAGGQIEIDAGTILLFEDSDIQTFVNSGENNGGDINITGNVLIALDDSDILAFAADGRGGDIDLSQITFFGEDFEISTSGTDRLTLADNNRVDINASGGLASGNISIPDASFIEDSLTELPDNLLASERLVANSCIARRGDAEGSFTVTGRRGIPHQPGISAQSTYRLDNVQENLTEGVLPPDESLIAEPQDVYRLADGRLVLSHECDG